MSPHSKSRHQTKPSSVPSRARTGSYNGTPANREDSRHQISETRHNPVRQTSINERSLVDEPLSYDNDDEIHGTQHTGPLSKSSSRKSIDGANQSRPIQPNSYGRRSRQPTVEEEFKPRSRSESDASNTDEGPTTGLVTLRTLPDQSSGPHHVSFEQRPDLFENLPSMEQLQRMKLQLEIEQGYQDIILKRTALQMSDGNIYNRVEAFGYAKVYRGDTVAEGSEAFLTRFRRNYYGHATVHDHAEITDGDSIIRRDGTRVRVNTDEPRRNKNTN